MGQSDGRMAVTRLAAVTLSLAIASLASCSSAKGREPSSASATTSSTMTTSQAEAKLTTPGYELTVAGAPSRDLSVTSAEVTLPSMPQFIRNNEPGVSVTLPDRRQPTSPLSLTFAFHGKAAPDVTSDMVPAVIAVSGDTAEPEVLHSQWDPTTKTLTAQTEHLSSFFPIVVDLKSVGNMFASAVNGFLGLAGAKPECVGQPLDVDRTTYTMKPESVPAAWPCMSLNGDTINVDLQSNSPNGWIVRSDPATKDMTVDLHPDVTNLVSQAAYGTIFSASVGNGTLLLPGGTTHLRFPKEKPPKTIGLRADPGVTLINGLSVGLNSLFPNAKVLSVLGMTNCAKPLVANLPEHDLTTASVGEKTRSLIDCVISTSDALSTKPKPGASVPKESIATKSLGALLSLGPSLANQLAATLNGLLGELTGSNLQTINITADEGVPVSSIPATLNLATKVTDNGAGLVLSPNHFQLSKRYDEQGRYYADINYKWTINRPPDSDLGYCKGRVTITNNTGDVVEQFNDTGFNACSGGGAFATNLKLFKTGTYTVTAEIEMERGPTLHGEQQFTLDP